MSNQRRNIIRAQRAADASQTSKVRQKLNEKLAKANATIERWWPRLLRAVHTLDKNQKQIARLKRLIQQLQS